MRPIPQAPCLALIHEFEQAPGGGFAATAYQDSAGFWTIGYGHKLPGPLSATWTQEQADIQALMDLTTAATGVSTAIDPGVLTSLTDNQYAACIDFAFNMGVGAFSGSTLCHYINVGALHLVSNQFGLWIHAKVNGVETVLSGLVRRRAAEVAVWNAS